MRSRPARLALSALAWIGLGAAAFLTFQIQQQIGVRRAALRAFEATSRDATDALGDAQAGQQAYVAPGQEQAEWGVKVAAYLQTASASVETLKIAAQSSGASPSLLDASAALEQIHQIDGRVRQRIAAGAPSDAAALIFSEAAADFSGAVSALDAAVTAERQTADEFEAAQQRLQIYALGGAAGVAALVLVVLGLVPTGAADAETALRDAASDTEDAMPLRVVPSSATDQLIDASAPASTALIDKPAFEALQGAVDVCAGFGRVRDSSDLAPLLERAAGALNARGLIVWLGSTAGADLRPVLAHGYSDATLARIPTVPRDADNAAATAYRTSTMQVVKSRPGGSQGAIAAPLVGPDGCIGALTAEIRDGREHADATCALAQICASQLAAVLAPAAAADASAPTHAATASGS
jgi:hypothetical protein